jgi:anthranilate synthase/indole-3-glycerol phosphate synthase/phosphoribosylanthranilate isomerase
VATLTDEELISFLAKSRELKMEPLVEVATEEEMTRAINVGSKVTAKINMWHLNLNR